MLFEGSVAGIWAAGVLCVSVLSCAILGPAFRWNTGFRTGSDTFFTRAELIADRKRERQQRHLVRTTYDPTYLWLFD